MLKASKRYQEIREFDATLIALSYISEWIFLNAVSLSTIPR
jgi:hypothetical protein